MCKEEAALPSQQLVQRQYQGVEAGEQAGGTGMRCVCGRIGGGGEGGGERHMARSPCHSLARAEQAPLLALAVSSEAHAIAALVAVTAPVGLAAGTFTAAHGVPVSIHDSHAIGIGHGLCPRGVNARHAQE